jgi:hypothetical protein
MGNALGSRRRATVRAGSGEITAEPPANSEAVRRKSHTAAAGVTSISM